MTHFFIDSPDGVHTVQFTMLGEVPHGETWHAIVINGRDLPKRFFGTLAQWSHDSRYLALQENHYDASTGSPSRVALIDIEKACVAYFPSTHPYGRVTDFHFGEGTFSFREHSTMPRATVKLTTIADWQPL